MEVLLIVVVIVVIFYMVIAIGLRVKPRPFIMPKLSQLETLTTALPAGLPPPVEHFYHLVFGDTVPIIRSAVFTGRGKIRPFGIWLPVRFVFVHNCGRDYRHYFEATLYGIPFLKVNEGILNGESFFESPMGTYYNDANTNQGANLALWAEAGWFPSAWVTDERVRWEAVDDHTAILYVPYGGEIETMVVRFHPETGMVDTMEAMRYREAGEGKHKILWITHKEQGPAIPGLKLSAVGSATWLDQGKPWAYFHLEETAYNVDTGEYIRKRGI